MAWPALAASLTLLAAGAAGAAEPPLRIERGGSNVVVRFTGSLLSAPQAEGPYQPVAGATNPHVVASTNTQQFWRSRPLGVATFAAGRQHGVALREDGTLWTWGFNTQGQLGNGTFKTGHPYGTNTPQPILPDVTWRAVAAGWAHTVALREDGTIWAWGRNDWGQLGNGTFTRQPQSPNGLNTPQAVLSDASWRAVAAGGVHTLALHDDGTLWTWGDNYYGQLGIGVAGWGTETNTPQPVLTNATWRAIAAGAYHTVALRADGTLWTWGLNDSGQLGDGTTNNASTPQPILPGTVWRAVAAGHLHTMALRADGTLWTWGLNLSGQLGDGTTNNASTPQPIMPHATWRAVAAGWFHALALREDGSLWAWGNNHNGQLGIGSSTRQPPYGISTPQPVSSSTTWQAIGAGEAYTVALRADGALWAWGWNGYGQLGNGTYLSTNTPQPALDQGFL